MRLQEETFTNEYDLKKHIAKLVNSGFKLSEIMVVTLARPNGSGYYHPGYLVMWLET